MGQCLDSVRPQEVVPQNANEEAKMVNFNEAIGKARGIILTLPVKNFDQARQQLQSGLGFDVMSEQDAESILYNASLSQHLFIRLIQSNKPLDLSDDHLCIFYLNDPLRYEVVLDAMQGAGALKVKSFNPYWDDYGTTWLIADEFRCVLCSGDYPGYRARIASPASNLKQVENYLTKHWGFKRIAHFENHRGFDGVMLATPSTLDCHFELTYCQHEELPASHDRMHQVSFLIDNEISQDIQHVDSYVKFEFMRSDVLLREIF